MCHFVIVVGSLPQVQCYHGFPDKLQVGAGFRISDGSSPVSRIKYTHRWNPFVDLEGDEEVWGEKFGVCLWRVPK